MKEKITEIWNNTELDNEAKLATLLEETKNFVPKARIEEYSKKVSSLENEKNELSTQFEDFKRSTMTEDEKVKADLETTKKKASKISVENILLKAGLTTEEYTDEDLSLLAVGDEETNVKLANFFITSLNKNSEKVKKETAFDLMSNTPAPVVGNPNAGQVSKVDELKARLDEAIKNKDTVTQASLYSQIAQAEQEQKV